MTHLNDLEVKVMVIDFNRCSGKAQVRRATLSCDSSYLFYSRGTLSMANITPKFFLMLQTIYINSLMNLYGCQHRNNLPDNFRVVIDL